MLYVYYFQQVAEKEDQVITTTKCSRCKGTFRQMIIQNDNSSPLLQVRFEYMDM